MLDLKKAFDTVDHKILLTKLQNYGIRGNALDLFQDYLSNRQQYVTHHNVASSATTIKCGVHKVLFWDQPYLLYILMILFTHQDLLQRYTHEKEKTFQRISFCRCNLFFDHCFCSLFLLGVFLVVK